MTKQLSPAAQAVLDAFNNRGLSSREWHDGKAASLKLAAALRAAADQCKIEWNYHPDYPETESVVVVSEFRAIADELEAL